MEKHNIEKTNLVAQARTNRKAAAEARYLLYDKFRKKDLSQNTVYIINDFDSNLLYIHVSRIFF